jgi:broad specificity phosphatase PhoE
VVLSNTVTAASSRQTKLAEDLRDKGITTIISSDLPRAMQTAEIVGDKLGIEVKGDKRLRPQRVPETDGIKIDPAKKIWKHFEDNPDERPAGKDAETWNEAIARQDEIVKEVEALAAQGETPLVMTHSRNLEAQLGELPKPTHESALSTIRIQKCSLPNCGNMLDAAAQCLLSFGPTRGDRPSHRLRKVREWLGTPNAISSVKAATDTPRIAIARRDRSVPYWAPCC